MMGTMIERLLGTATVFPIIVALLVASALAGTMDEVVKRGTLRIGVAQQNFLPWIGRNPSGKLLGFEIDVAQDLARTIGVRPEFVQLPFDTLLNNLVKGDIDVIISGYSVTGKRARSVLFSSPYGNVSYWLVVDLNTLPAGAEKGDYDAEGYKIGVMAGSVAEELAREMFLKAEIVPLADEGAARDALNNREINGIVVPSPYPTYMMARNPGRYGIGSDNLFSTAQAIAVRTDSLRFINFINAWINSIKANGRLEEARSYWFDTLDWQGRVAGKNDAAAEKPAKNR